MSENSDNQQQQHQHQHQQQQQQIPSQTLPMMNLYSQQQAYQPLQYNNSQFSTHVYNNQLNMNDPSNYYYQQQQQSQQQPQHLFNPYQQQQQQQVYNLPTTLQQFNDEVIPTEPDEFITDLLKKPQERLFLLKIEMELEAFIKDEK